MEHFVLCDSLSNDETHEITNDLLPRVFSSKGSLLVMYELLYA